VLAFLPLDTIADHRLTAEWGLVPRLIELLCHPECDIPTMALSALMVFVDDYGSELAERFYILPAVLQLLGTKGDTVHSYFILILCQILRTQSFFGAAAVQLLDCFSVISAMGRMRCHCLLTVERFESFVIL
jgi:hypothetical protein